MLSGISAWGDAGRMELCVEPRPVHGDEMVRLYSKTYPTAANAHAQIPEDRPEKSGWIARRPKRRTILGQPHIEPLSYWAIAAGQGDPTCLND